MIALHVLDNELIDLGLINLYVGVCLVDSSNLRGIIRHSHCRSVLVKFFFYIFDELGEPVGVAAVRESEGRSFINKSGNSSVFGA